MIKNTGNILMKKWNIRLISIPMILLSTICSATPIVLDFEGYAPDSELGGVNADNNYFMEGYNVWLPKNGAFWNDTSYYVRNDMYPDSGSDWLATRSISIQSLETVETERQFDVISADIAEWPFSNGSNILNYEIYTSDYSFLYGEIILDDYFGFETIFFSDDFKNINAVKFYSEDVAFGYDNIVISSTPTIVPSPPSISLLLSSLIFLSIFKGIRRIKY